MNRTAKNWTTYARSLAILTALSLAASCAGRQAAKNAANPLANAPTQRVSAVSIRLGPTFPPTEQGLFQELDGTARLRAATERHVQTTGKLDSQSGRVLEVEISDFRVRSGALVFWAGIMAGVDVMEVVARVRDGDHVVKEYTTGSGSTGAFAGLSSSSRFDILVQEVAERVAEGL